MEIPRGKGLSKGKILEAKYEAKLKSLGRGGGGGKTEKPSVEEVKIFSGTTHHTCNQSVGKDIGHHPLCVGDHNDITIQKPVCTSQYSYVYSRLGLHLIVSLDYLSGKSVGKKYS